MTFIRSYFNLDNIRPLDFSQDYHNITLSEVKTLENTLSHSQVFSIILGENARLDFFGKMGLRIVKLVSLN